MKVLVLNGSPRGERSNTLKITKSFLKGLGNENEVNIINVSKTEIAPCLGCFACWGKTPGKCVIKDDMEKLIELYLEADMVVWSFPLYYYGMPSKLKALLDRLLPTNLPTIEYSKDSISSHPQRYDLSGRKNMVISTCGFPSLKGNYEPLTLQLKYIFPENLSYIYCAEGELFKSGRAEQLTEPYLKLVEKAGKEIKEKNEISESLRDELEKLIVPAEIFVDLANKSWGK